jgi:hypothetical protein
VLGDVEEFQRDPRWRDRIPFYEYFDGDTGRGVGASHQTGWTALAVRCLEDIARRREPAAPAGSVRRSPRPAVSRR